MTGCLTAGSAWLVEPSGFSFTGACGAAGVALRFFGNLVFDEGVWDVKRHTAYSVLRKRGSGLHCFLGFAGPKWCGGLGKGRCTGAEVERMGKVWPGRGLGRNLGRK